MDVLSDVLRSIRLSGAVLFRAEFSAPWAVAAPASQMFAPLLKPDAARLVLFHVVAQGEGWAELESGERAAIRAGDIVVLCGGEAHVLGGGAPQRTVSIAELLPPPPWPEPPRVCYGGGGARTTIVCGFLHCEELLFHPLFRTLPRLLRVHCGASAEWVETNLRYPLEEVRAGRPGSDSLLARSAELLLLDVLRRHIAALPAQEVGWLAALRDPPIAKALELMHESPAASWSVTRLARLAGISRSVLADRFRIRLGQPPMHYLTRWRLQLAARLLREDHRESIAAIAERVGYESERAFHRAFKRHAGVTPAAWRDAARPPNKSGAGPEMAEAKRGGS